MRHVLTLSTALVLGGCTLLTGADRTQTAEEALATRCSRFADQIWQSGNDQYTLPGQPHDLPGPDLASQARVNFYEWADRDAAWRERFDICRAQGGRNVNL